jgi:hypothetical protein
MVSKRELKILEYAYINDLADTIDFKEKELDSLMRRGLLQNKHKTPKSVFIYWISEKGLRLLKEKGKTFR